MEDKKQYNFTRFITPDLTKAKICLLLTYARESGFSGPIEFLVSEDVAKRMEEEGHFEEIVLGTRKNYGNYIRRIEIRNADKPGIKVIYIEVEVDNSSQDFIGMSRF